MALYTIHELQSRAELDAVVAIIIKAHSAPYLPSVATFFPVFGYTEEARAAGLAAAQERLWNENVANANVHWIFVRNEASGEIVGGTMWEWNEHGSTFKNGIPKIDCYWWPDVEARKFCEEMVRQWATPRTIWMRRPYARLSTMAVHPAHRRHGIGSLMMAWCVAKIDDIGAESYLEASELGRGLYEANGYITVMKLSFFLPSDKRDEWSKYAHDFMFQDIYCLWRPKGGEAGERERPWQLVQPIEP